MKSRIHYTKPSITELEISYATDAARNGWGEQCYAYIARFETLFKTHLGVKHAIATSSCTGAIHLALAALGIGPGDEVIVADTNWIATVAPAVHLGAKPVFVDVLEDSWCLDPARVEAAITRRTKAILAVHLYGNLADMDALLAIGNRHGIAVVEDAAEGLGAVYSGKRAGSMGRCGAFSFHGTKTMTTGEGGMFVTNDDALYETVLTLSNHGRARGQKRQFWPEMVGYKYKLSNLQAAIGCAQVERVIELTSRKRAILAYYRERLEKDGVARMNPEPADGVNGAWMPTIVFSAESGITQAQVQAALVEENADARAFFEPLSSLPMFSPCSSNVVAHELPHRAINLPSFHDMTENELDRVAGVVRRIIDR